LLPETSLDLDRRAQTPPTADELWEVFASSGYLTLSGKSPADFTDLRHGFDTVTKKLALHPALGGSALVREDSGLMATLTASKIYSGSYLLHQLAKFQPEHDRQAAKRALWGIYSGAHDLVSRAPDARWTIMYASDQASSWQERSLLAFLRAHPDPAMAALIRFRLMEVSTEDRARHAHTNIEVSRATSQEQRNLAETLEREHSTAYLQALDLTCDEISLTSCRTQMRAAGLERARCVFLARRSGVLVAAMVAELGEPGLNLFHLYDSARVFDLGDLDDDVRKALLDSALAWFHQRGRRRFIYYNEHAPARGADDLGLRDLGLGYVCIMSAALVRQYLEHLATITIGAAAPAPCPDAMNPATLPRSPSPDRAPQRVCLSAIGDPS
jgi:hypothetical protein